MLRNELYYFRRKLGYTQKEIAERIGLTTESYLNKETGQYEFSLTEAKRVAEVLEISLDRLWELLITYNEDRVKGSRRYVI